MKASAQMYSIPTLNFEKYVIDGMMSQTLQHQTVIVSTFVTFQSKSYKVLSVCFINSNKHFAYFR